MNLYRPFHTFFYLRLYIIVMFLSLHVCVYGADAGPEPGKAQELPEIVVSAPGLRDYSKAAPALEGAAEAAAPAHADLEATQPQAIIERGFIEKSVPPTGDYTNAVNIAPSISGVSLNGPGLSEATFTLRGFQDGQYNVTFDGIPFADTYQPDHHSNSFFPAAVIGAIVLERGPGNASNLGQATFGGSLNLYSREASQEGRLSPYLSFGSWNTRLMGVAVESGRLKNLGDATIQLNYQHTTSDGWLTLNDIRNDNLTLKVERPLGSSSLLTLFFSYNDIAFHATDSTGITLQQAAQFGKNYSLNKDPSSQNFVGYNLSKKQTEFAYLRLQTGLGSGWSGDNRIYTYYYNFNGRFGLDASGATPNGTMAAPPGNSDVPGYIKHSGYRVTGDILNMTKIFTSGLLRTGLWIEQAYSNRNVKNMDWTLNLPNPVWPTSPANVKYDMSPGWTQYQTFAEFEWAAAQGMTVTPGLKLVSFRRTIDASVNAATRKPLSGSETYNAILPFLTINKQLDADWSAYAQFAGGMLVPSSAVFNVTNLALGRPAPEKTVNYQAGVVHKTKRLTFDADLYYLDFNNKLAVQGSGDNKYWYNQGGVVYKGLEAQATYVLGAGLSIYGNGSVNRAIAKATGLDIANAPRMTAALGVLYNHEPWDASFLYKQTGTQYAADGAPAAYKIPAWSNADLNVGYTIAKPGIWAKSLKLQFSSYNIFNKQAVVSVVPNAKPQYDQYSFQPQRSYMVSLKGDF